MTRRVWHSGPHEFAWRMFLLISALIIACCGLTIGILAEAGQARANRHAADVAQCINDNLRLRQLPAQNNQAALEDFFEKARARQRSLGSQHPTQEQQQAIQKATLDDFDHYLQIVHTNNKVLLSHPLGKC